MRRGDDHLGIQLSQHLCLVLFFSLLGHPASWHLGTWHLGTVALGILATWHLASALGRDRTVSRTGAVELGHELDHEGDDLRTPGRGSVVGDGRYA